MQIFPCSEQKNTYADVGDRESSQAGAGPPRAARGPREDFLKRAPGPFVPHISLPSRLGSLFMGQVRSPARLHRTASSPASGESFYSSGAGAVFTLCTGSSLFSTGPICERLLRGFKPFSTYTFANCSSVFCVF